MKQTVAITGGTGHLGTALIELLIEKEFNIKALHYNTKPSIEHPNLTWIKGDINDSDVISQLISGTQVVVHCAALISISDQSKEQLFKINVTGTSCVINACLKTQSIRLIHVSSSIVTQLDDNSSYASSKIKAEHAILEAVTKQHLNAVILRPTAVVGPPDKQPSLLGQTISNLAKGTVPMVTTGGYDMIDVRDLSQTILNSFTKGEKGATYLLSGSYCSIQKLAQLANPNKTIPVVSTRWLLALFPLVKGYLKLTKSSLPLTRNSLRTLQHSLISMNAQKAKAELNHKCRTIETTILDLLQWFEKNKCTHANH